MGREGNSHGHTHADTRWHALWCLLPFALLGALVALLVRNDLPLTASIPWAPTFGVPLAFRLDGLSALFLLLITGIGSAVFVYASGYMAGNPRTGRLYLLLALFMGAMIGCVAADNLILLFVFWELTSLTSFLLVGFDHHLAASRKSAQQAFLVTGTGGLALLAGFLLLGREAGTYSLSGLIAVAPDLEPTRGLVAGVALTVIGCMTKSAQFPFHFWLPNAMAAPTPVSAYLHSATMVKLGVYLLARLDPAFGDRGAWQAALVVVGSYTAAWCIVQVVRERDLKRVLAWSTVAALGTLVMLVGLPGDGAAIAVATFLVAHALYKAPLFFVAGNVDHGTGTRIIDNLGGLRVAMPWTAAAALLAGVSMAGLPTSFGYIAKDVIATAKDALDPGLLDVGKYANYVFSAVGVAVAAVAAIRVFWRHPGRNETCEAHEGPLAMTMPPIVVALCGVVLGIHPAFADALLAEAARAMTPGAGGPLVMLKLEAGTTLKSLALTFSLGAVVFWFWDQIHGAFEKVRGRMHGFSGLKQYERSLQTLAWSAARVSRLIQHGRLTGYLTVAFLAVAVVGWVSLLAAGLPPRTDGGAPLTLPVAAALAALAFGAVAACFIRGRLLLLLASGLVGFGSAALYLFTGAPDLAFTQFAVETVYVVVIASLLLVLRRGGRDRGRPEARVRVGAGLVAVGVGGLFGALLLFVHALPMDGALARYFGEQSLLAAYGRNVVNVIIVDFRGLDTLGEIAVVAFSFVASVTLIAALRRRRSA